MTQQNTTMALLTHNILLSKKVGKFIAKTNKKFIKLECKKFSNMLTKPVFNHKNYTTIFHRYKNIKIHCALFRYNSHVKPKK